MSTAISSRVGRKPVVVPSGVEVKIVENLLSVKGPKGQISLPIHRHSMITVENNQIKVQSSTEPGYIRKGSGSKLLNSITGTLRAKISNMVHGVSKGFEKKLVLVGVGFRAQVKGKNLLLTIGYSHPVEIEAPEGVTIEAPTLTEILVKGVDKHLVGHLAARIRAVRPPEPYKGKGIRYSNENVARKETKKK